MISGTTYLESGRPVVAVTAWCGKRAPEPHPALVLVTTRRHGPRNVAIRRGDGTVVVRPFRGLRVSREDS